MLDTTNTSSYLNSLIGVGADAMSNLYYVEFIDNTKAILDLDGANLTVRNKDFTLPTFAQETHTVHYMTTSVDLPKPSWSGEKVLKFNFRVDNNYHLYSALGSWRDLTSTPHDAFAANTIPGEEDSGVVGGVIINVYSLSTPIGGFDSDKETPPAGADYALPSSSRTLLYKFEGCWIKSISGLTYSYESADPLTVSVEIAFSSFNRTEGLSGTRLLEA